MPLLQFTMKIQILADWNPWWVSGSIPQVLVGRERSEISELYSMMDKREILILSGVRRSGKTTMMYQLIGKLLERGTGVSPENILFVNVEDPSLVDVDFDTILSTYRQRFTPEGRIYIFLDEIQARKGWELWMKKYYDLGKDIKFVISGSNSTLLQGEYSTSLTGRNITRLVFPISFREYRAFQGLNNEANAVIRGGTEAVDSMIHDLDEYLENGGFPEPFFRGGNYRSSLLSQYFQDIIYRDIVHRHNVNADKVTKLALHLVTNSGNPMTLNRLRNITGLSFDSLRNFITYSEESFLMKRVDMFSFSMRSAISERFPRKYYCVDSGLRNTVSHRFSRDVGRNAENVVAVELWRRGCRFHYWKEKVREVDFVYLSDDLRPVAINVSYTDIIEDREIQGLKEFARAIKGDVEHLLLLTKNVEDTIEVDGKTIIEVIPLWKWLLDV